MPFPSALSAGNLTSLRGTTGTPSRYAASQFLLLGSNTTVFAARVNQATFSASFAQITYDTVTTGAYTDILPGMTVLISTTNDRRAAYFVGRVRATPTSAILYINETSATVADNDYIWVLRDYRLFHELGRFSAGVYYKDYNLTFAQLKPLISGLQSAYAGIVSGSPAGFTVAFSASAVAATSGATISSYAWTIPTGGTVTAGATNAASVTVRFDASASEYWVKLVVTDSGSRTQTRFIPVWAIPANLSTTIALGFTGAALDGNLDSGWSASIEAFTGVDTILDNTLACVLDVEYYNGTETSLVSTVKFVGRLRTESNRTEADAQIATSRKVSYEIEGTAAQMARITTPIITMRDASSPATWDEIKSLTIWRSVAYLLEHSTFHNLHSLSFDSTADTYRAFQLLAPQGNLFQAVQDLLSSINAGLEFAQTGEARAVRDANFMTTAERSALTTVIGFTSEDWISFSLERDQAENIGIIEASGGTYFPTGGILASMVTPLLSIAPGVAQGNAEGVGQLHNQILTANIARTTAQSELNTRTGNKYALELGGDVLNVDMRGGYNFIIPSRYQWYTFTMAAGDNTGGRAYTTSNRWWCKSISIRHNNDTGTKEVNAVFQLETSGANAGATGQTVVIPPAGTPPNIPDIPPISPYPYFPPPPGTYLPPSPTPADLPPYTDPGDVINGIPVDGNANVIWTSEHVWWTRNFLGVPRWYDITPASLLGTVRDVALEGPRIYILSSNGTNSTVYTASNAFVASPSYTDSGTISGVYTEIGVSSTLGSLYIKSLSTGAWTYDVDFTITDGSFHPYAVNYPTDPGPDSYFGVYGAGGWGQAGVTNYTHVCYIAPLPRGSTFDMHLTSITFTTSVTPGYGLLIILYKDGVEVDREPNTGFTGGVSTLTWTGDLDIDFFVLLAQESAGAGSTLTAKITSATIAGTGENLWVAAGSQNTLYSSDYAATFGSSQAAGTPPAGGSPIANEQIGTPLLVGASGQVLIATSAGGAYSNYGTTFPTGGRPTFILVPRRQFGGTTNNTSTTTPQFLAISNLPATSETAWKVTASGATYTAITPTVSGNDGLATSTKCADMPWWSGNRIAAVLNFGGTPRLVVSTNAGGAWTDRGALDDNARMVRYRRGDRTMQQLFIANGGPAFSPNHGSSIVTKSYPADSATEPLLGILPYG